MLERPPKRTGFGRDSKKHVELCVEPSQTFQNLALFSVDMYFRANVTMSFKKLKVISQNCFTPFSNIAVTVSFGTKRISEDVNTKGREGEKTWLSLRVKT